jgi:hypothetical protein
VDVVCEGLKPGESLAIDILPAQYHGSVLMGVQVDHYIYIHG